MICPNCGNEIDESHDYCPRCGAKLNVSQSALKEQIEETRHNEHFCWILITVGVVIAAVGAITDIRPSDPVIANLVLAGIFIAIGSGLGLWAYYSAKRKILLKQLDNMKR